MSCPLCSLHDRSMKLIVDLDIILQSAMNNLSALHMEDVDPVIKQLDDARGQIQTFMCTPNSSANSSPGATTEHKSE